MPRKTIAGLEAIIAEKDNEIVSLNAKMAGYDDGKAPDLSYNSKEAIQREVGIAHAVSQHVGRRKMRKILNDLNTSVRLSLPACWNFLKSA